MHPPAFLTASLLTIYVRSIQRPPVPLQVHLAFDAISARLPGSNERKWRIQYMTEKNTWPGIGGRRTVRLIVWPWSGPGEEPKWAAEAMLHFLLGKEEGRLENVAWRFGPGAGGAEERWDDWRMFHFEKYYGVSMLGDASEVDADRGAAKGLVLIGLKRGRESMVAETVVDLVWRGVKQALGKPFEPDQAQLGVMLRRVAERLGQKGTEVRALVVGQRFRKSGKKEQYIPAACVQVYTRVPDVLGKIMEEDEEEEVKQDASNTSGAAGEVVAVIMIDVWGKGKVKLMGVMYPDERPVAHFYRSRFPPPDPASIRQAVKDVRAGREGQAPEGESAGSGEKVKAAPQSKEGVREQEAEVRADTQTE
jgi:hypothetical protein